MSRVEADSTIAGEALAAGPGPKDSARDWAGSRRLGGATLSVVVVVAALGLYLSTLSKHYSEGEDSASYVVTVTRPSSLQDLCHPNHLAYLGLNRLVYMLVRAAGYPGDAALPMKVVSAVAGAWALGIMTRIMRRLGVDDRLVLVWVAITAVTFGYWSYSTQAETYTLPLPFFLLAVLVVIELGDGPFSPGAFASLGLFNALTTLVHQMHIIIYPLMIVAVVAIWYRRRSNVPLGRLVAGLTIFGAVSAVIVGLAYFAAALGPLGLRDLGSIIRWSKGHGNQGPFYHVQWSNPLVSLIAIGHAVLGGHFLYGIDSFYDLFVRRFPDKLLLEERYVALQIPAAVRLTCLAASGLAAVSGLTFLGSLLFARKEAYHDRAQSLKFFASDAIIWPTLLVSFLFNTIMEPTTIEWWVLPIPVAAIGIASLQARRPRSSDFWPAGAVFAAALIVANGAGAILPQTDLRADYWYQANRYLIDHARPGDVIITDGGFISDWYLRVHTGASVIPARLNANDRLPRILHDSGSQRVWISSWVVEPLPEVRMTRTLPPIDEKALQRLLQAVADRMVKRDVGPYQTIWELVPTAQ
jgi:hypothetical protein